MTDDDILDRVLQHEGGFVNDPKDAGGATNMGITAKTLGNWRKLGRNCTADEVRKMSRDEAVAIYKDQYITTPHFNLIGDGNLRMIVVDTAVLFGPSRAAKFLQTALGVDADGAIGQGTKAALDKADPKAIGNKVIDLRAAYHEARVAAKPDQQRFLKGWLNRCTDLRQYCSA
jgi:lysozyme family protein